MLDLIHKIHNIKNKILQFLQVIQNKKTSKLCYCQSQMTSKNLKNNQKKIFLNREKKNYININKNGKNYKIITKFIKNLFNNKIVYNKNF